MTEAERKLLIWLGELYMRASPLTYEAGEISELIAAVRRPIPQPAPEAAEAAAELASGFSWDGFRILGDAASIGEVQRLIQAHAELSALRDRMESAPAKVAPAPVTEAMVEAALLKWGHAAPHRLPQAYREGWRAAITAALAAAPPDPLRVAVERFAAEIDKGGLGSRAVAARIRAILETGRG